MSNQVLVEQTGRTVFFTINRPESRNSLTRRVLGELTSAIDQRSRDPDVRCLVFKGAGNHFCSGADIRGAMAEDPEIMQHLDLYMDAFHGLIRAVVRSPKPTIASMDGAAVGFGADLALACDLRVASTAAFLQEKFVAIGLMPDGGGTFWLPRLLGTARAMRAMLLGDKLEAKELDALGLLVACVPSEELAAATQTLAERIEKGPPLAYARIKSSIYANWGDLEGALRREREGQLELLRTRDMLEGVAAFAEKRPPSFTGQ